MAGSLKLIYQELSLRPQTERCSFTAILSVCLSMSLCVRALQVTVFTDLNDTMHKNSIWDREEAYCLVTL